VYTAQPAFKQEHLSVRWLCFLLFCLGCDTDPLRSDRSESFTSYR
jgi:hypothetical protein